jgi:hypothetical protein
MRPDGNAFAQHVLLAFGEGVDGGPDDGIATTTIVASAQSRLPAIAGVAWTWSRRPAA